MTSAEDRVYAECTLVSNAKAGYLLETTLKERQDKRLGEVEIIENMWREVLLFFTAKYNLSGLGVYKVPSSELKSPQKARASASGSLMAKAEVRHRAKVYCLNEDGQWDDKGTGHAAVQYMPVRRRLSSSACLRLSCLLLATFDFAD